MMFFLYIVASVLFAGGVVTQVIVPFANDRTFFPFFRRKAFKQLRDADQDLKQAQRALTAAQTRKEAAEVQKQAATIEAETAEIEMRTYDLREGLLDGRIESERALALTDGAPSNGTPLPNGKDTTH
jgi:hypothetical protein